MSPRPAAACLVLCLSCGGGAGGGPDLGRADGGGCPNDLPAACPAQVPSYAADIAPLLQRRCLVCHAPGGPAASRPLTSYAAVYTLRTTVLSQVYGCVMPPPGATPLTGAERASLLAWLVCKAPDN